MTQRPLVHIGYQKTASTFLQKKIFADDTVFVRPWGTQPSLAIEHFVLEHPQKFDPAKVRDAFGTYNDRIPVISHEDLSGYPVYGRYYAEVVAERVKRTFPDAVVMICVREQVSMMVSQYFQSIRQGGTMSLDELLSEGDARPGFRPVFRKEHFEYDLMHDIFSAHFPSDQLLMLPHELLAQRPDVYFQKINDLLGTSLAPPEKKKAVHEKRGGAAAQLERTLNKLIHHPSAPPSLYKDYPLAVRAQNRLVRYVDNLTKKHTNFGQHFEQKIRRTAEQRIGNYFHSSNARLEKVLGYDLSDLGYPVSTED